MNKTVITAGRSVPAEHTLTGNIIATMFGLMILFVSVRVEANVPTLPGIWLSKDAEHGLPESQEKELIQDLRRITGLPKLTFDQDGRLLLGDVAAAEGGAEIARQILLCALGSGGVFVIEDYSGSSSVTFGQMDEGTHYEDLRVACQLMIWRIRLDFDDFREMTAPPEVRESFNAGFTMLHELSHGLGYRDAKQVEEIGDCERLINQARGELGLPLRDQYFADTLQITPNAFTVRLRFREASTKKSLLNKQTRRRSQYLFFLLPYDFKP